jgi:predicted RNA-binding Zn-ribbon protein involved in translation (DUF1610 family)
MKKCELCGKEVQFIFRCKYCQKTFCSEHRLPENHSCTAFNHKRTPFSAPILQRSIPTWKSTPDRFMCPNCGNYEEDCISFDAETMTFECRECGNKWTQKKSTFEYVPLREKSELKKKEAEEKPRKKYRFF